MYKGLYEYLNNYLNDLLCRFCKTNSTQHVFSRLILSLKKELDNSGLAGTTFMDLPKTYNCLRHDLLIEKIEAYGLNLVDEYSRFQKQKKIGSSYCHLG